MDNTTASTELEKFIFNNTISVYTDFIPKLVDVYKTTYEDLLLSLDVDERSLSKPINFFEDYLKELNEFVYVRPHSKKEIKIVIPSEDTFVFEGRLKFIELLLKGTTSFYYELPVEDYNYLMNKAKLGKKLKEILQELPVFSNEEQTDLDFYILDSSYNIHTILQQILKKELIIFPFSNMQPLDLFDDGINFFNKSTHELDNLITSKSITDLKRRLV